MKHEGVDRVRQLFNQQQNDNSANYNSHSTSQGTTQQQHFTDL